MLILESLLISTGSAQSLLFYHRYVKKRGSASTPPFPPSLTTARRSCLFLTRQPTYVFIFSFGKEQGTLLFTIRQHFALCGYDSVKRLVIAPDQNSTLLLFYAIESVTLTADSSNETPDKLTYSNTFSNCLNRCG